MNFVNMWRIEYRINGTKRVTWVSTKEEKNKTLEELKLNQPPPTDIKVTSHQVRPIK